MNSPAIGTFIKPVGTHAWFCYCLEVVEVVSCDVDKGQWVCKRWGMKSGQPCKDDGPQSLHYYNGMQAAAPGVWKDPSAMWCEPLYFRKIETKGQQDLFI